MIIIVVIVVIIIIIISNYITRLVYLYTPAAHTNENHDHAAPIHIRITSCRATSPSTSNHISPARMRLKTSRM